MGDNCIDTVLAELCSVEKQLPLSSNYGPSNILEDVRLDLRFLKMFLCCLLRLEDTDDADIRHILMSVNRTCEDMLGVSSTYKLLKSTKHEIEAWIWDLGSRIQTCRMEFEESKFELLLGYSLRCNNPINKGTTVEFLADILQNLKDLYKFITSRIKTGDEILLLNNGIATLEGKVTLLHNFFNLIPVQWWDFEEMRAFDVSVNVFALYSAILAFLYWVKGVDKRNILLFDVVEKYVPASKVVYIRFFEEMKSRRFEYSLISSGQIIQSFLDLILENIILHISKDDFQIIQESLFLVISFLVNPPYEHVVDEELMMLTAEMDLLVKQDLYRVLYVEDIKKKKKSSKANTCLSDFMRKAELVKGMIQQVYEQTRDSFSYEFAKVNGLGCFDFLLQNHSILKKKLKRETDFIPFAKHLIIRIEEEVMSLRSYLDDIFKLQKEQKELKDAMLKVIDLAYQSEYSINLWLVTGNPLWYNMARLMEVLDNLKDVNSNLKTLQIESVPHSLCGFPKKIFCCLAVAPNRVPQGPTASGFSEVMVGLEEEVDSIVENLINKSKSLGNVGVVTEAQTWFLDVQGMTQHCKQNCELMSQLLSSCSFICNYFDYEHLSYLDVILNNLKDLDKDIIDYEIPITTLHNMLRLLHILFDPAPPEEWSGFKEMRKFKVVVHSFAHYLTILVFCYWVKTIDEGRAAHLRLLLIEVLKKYRSCVPVFKAFCNRFLEETKFRQLYSPPLGEIVQIFLDLLFDSLDEFEKVHFIPFQKSAMFVITFLALPLHQCSKDKETMAIIVEIEVLVFEYLDLFLLFDKREVDLSRASSDFTRKVELLKSKILQVDNPIPDTFSYDIPKINGLGYFDFLIQNIGFMKEEMNRDETFIPFAKHLIIKIHEELLYLRPYLDDLFEQQKENYELKETWLKVISLAYRTEYAINLYSLLGHQSWYNMARLMEVLYEIKAVYSMRKKINGIKTQGDGGIHCTAVALNSVPKDSWVSGSNAVMVGLENEVSTIIENLINGSKILTVVAIVGMAGIGKTTIANKVYNAPAVRHHFYMFAYCVVSQVYSAKMLLLDILCGIKEKDDKMYDMNEEDLAHMLRKCLKGQRYLIIMDDIWDVKAWDDVKSSLPDDRNGSRIIFTSRIRNVASQANKDCIVHDLRFLSDEESLELLQNKAFPAECFPPNFLEVGKVIAKNCKGLPLKIVLIAGLIAKTERNLDWWKKISKTIESYVFTEDCMDILELSYQHLPEHLKQCFLYFGAFGEATSIPANKLTLLWIAEGFVQNSNNENLEKTAKEYLCDLVGRSLVISNERSSYGGIKSCRIHDLLHEFCQKKAQEENFFEFMDGYEASSSSSSTVRNPYRVSIHMKGKHLGDATKICPNVHSLLDSRKCGYNPYDIIDVNYLKLVQVINLEEFERENLIRKIPSLFHLRFLAISFVSEQLSSQLTRKLSYLRNLEVLIFTGRRSFKLVLPKFIWNMTRLRHVDIGVCSLSSLSVHEGESYPQMIFLESFSSPSISSTKVLEDLLQRSPSLRKLGFIYDSSGEERDFHFPKLSKLESLNVSSVGEPFLRSLDFLSILKKLSLSNCCIQWRYLPAISKMPCLEVLKLLDYAFIGHVWDMEDTEFPKLKTLKLQRLYVGEWIAYPESFPSLEALIVIKCCKLKAIPPCFGDMTTLKRIEVFESDGAATSVVEIQDVQKDYGNEELEVVSAPSKKENFLLHASDEDSCDENDELEEETEAASLCA